MTTIRIRQHTIGHLLAFVIGASCLLAAGIPSAVDAAQTADVCAPAASPASSPVATAAGVSATPVLELPDTDLAWLDMQQILASGASDLATLATPGLQHEELLAFAQAQIQQAATDAETIENWQDAWYPGADVPVEYALTTIFNGKMDLDLPAGAGGVDTLGASGGIALICANDGPDDQIYLASSIDLAQQQIDLAQVAIVYATHPELIAYAQGVIDREQANIGQLLTWQEEWFGPPASPAATR
jgi:uncharacterized protein (DUF305 family)